MQKYIKEELNCFNLEFEEKEADFVVYSCDPDNKQIGSVLKKAFNKEFSAELRALTTDQLKEYLAGGKVSVKGHEL